MQRFASGREILIGHAIPGAPTADAPEMHGAMRAGADGLPEYRNGDGWRDMPVVLPTVAVTRTVGPGGAFVDLGAALAWAAAHVQSPGGKEGVILETLPGVTAAAPIDLRGLDLRHVWVRGAGISVPLAAMTAIVPDEQGNSARAFINLVDAGLVIDCPVTCTFSAWTGGGEDLGPSGELLYAVLARGGAFVLGPSGAISGFTTGYRGAGGRALVEGTITARRRGLIAGAGDDVTVLGAGQVQGVQALGGRITVRGAKNLRRGSSNTGNDIVVADGGHIVIANAGVLGGLSHGANVWTRAGRITDVRAYDPGALTPLPVTLNPAAYRGAQFIAEDGRPVYSDGTTWRRGVDEARVAEIAEEVAADVARLAPPGQIVTLSNTGPEVPGVHYTSINRAIQYLTGFLRNHNAVNPVGRRSWIRMLSGYKLDEQVRLRGINAANISLVADDLRVQVDMTALTVQTSTEEIGGTNYVHDVFHGTDADMPNISGVIFEPDAGTIPQDPARVALTGAYTPRSRGMMLGGVSSANIQIRQIDANGAPITPRPGGFEGFWANMRGETSTRVVMFGATLNAGAQYGARLLGTTQIGASTATGCGPSGSLRLGGQVLFVASGSGDGGTFPGVWSQDFRRTSGVDDATDIILEGASVRVNTPLANFRGGWSITERNVATPSGQIFWQDFTDRTVGTTLAQTLTNKRIRAISLTSSDNLNSLGDGGIFGNPTAGNTAGNNYPVSTAGILLHFTEGTASQRRSQIFMPFQTALTPNRSAVYVRSIGASDTWGPWEEIWTSRGAVRAVSQAGGIPTGGLLEFGSAASGAFERTTAGWQRCIRTDLTAASSDIANGALWRSGDVTWTFPAAFASGTKPAVSIVGENAEFAGAAIISISNTAVTFRVKTTASVGSAITLNLSAIGRWSTMT